MQAKLKTKTYDLIDNGVRQSNQADGANVLALILTNVEDMDELVNEATDCEKIEILDGSSVVMCFEDYINFRSISAANGQFEIVVQQDNSVQQIITLKATVKAQQETIDTQGRTIEAQAATIEEQEATIAELQESQDAQDTDISDITDAVLEISEIVYGGDES
jgi:hypothetical protein